MSACIVAVLEQIISLLLELFFVCFVNSHVLQSRVHGLPANFITYRFDDNISLIALLFACANLWCHIFIASFAESDLFVVSCSTFFAVLIFLETLAGLVITFVMNKLSDSLLYMSAKILLSPLSNNIQVSRSIFVDTPGSSSLEHAIIFIFMPGI